MIQASSADLPADSPLWPWQPAMCYRVVDEGAFPEDDLAARDALLALLFRLENAPGPEQTVVLADAVLGWFRRHPGFERVQSVFVDVLGAIMAPLAPGVRMPEELSEVRNMLATRAETWKQQLLQEGEQRGRLAGQQEGRQEGERSGLRQGEAAILLRLLERRFGPLPGWARDRIAAAGTADLEEWSLRLLEVTSLEDALT